MAITWKKLEELEKRTGRVYQASRPGTAEKTPAPVTLAEVLRLLWCARHQKETDRLLKKHGIKSPQELGKRLAS